MIDHVTLGLRLREGVSLDGFVARFGDNLTEVIGETGTWLTSQAFLENGGGRLRVAAEHQLITNEILVRLEEPIAAYVRRETSASQIAPR